MDDGNQVMANESLKTAVAVVSTKLDNLTNQFDKFDSKLNQNYVTREDHAILEAKVIALRQEIDPLKRFVYGMITIFAIGVVGAILKLVLK